jgi:hypothetical protein
MIDWAKSGMGYLIVNVNYRKGKKIQSGMLYVIEYIFGLVL